MRPLRLNNSNDSPSSASHSSKKSANNGFSLRPRTNHQWLLFVTLVGVVMLLLLRDESSPVRSPSSSSVQQQDVLVPTNTTVHSENQQANAEPIYKPIRQISILGERNSGTRWTFDHISECFNHSLYVKKELTRYKHWFQFNDSSKYPHDTLVLAQFRNPYDWFKAMEHVPHHSPAHLRTHAKASTSAQNALNDWYVFLNKTWTMPRVGLDLELFGNETCQEDFLYRDIVSCVIEPLPRSHYNYTIRYSEHQPFYEMRNDGSGLPYDNILELRTDKIRNFLNVANYPGIADAWVIQYEYLLTRGTQHLIDRIAEWTGVEPKCHAKPPQNRVQKKSRVISKEFAEHVRLHLNWTVESWIGYEIEWTREEEPQEW